eukprot:1855399-Prymnesium_polylepis.2
MTHRSKTPRWRRLRRRQTKLSTISSRTSSRARSASLGSRRASRRRGLTRRATSASRKRTPPPRYPSCRKRCSAIRSQSSTENSTFERCSDTLLPPSRDPTPWLHDVFHSSHESGPFPC